MTPTFATSLEAMAEWRAALARRLDDVSRFLGSHELADAASIERIAALRERLGHEKLVVAFVAEFSRGKSELINAIFFADTGRRVLPATPGRTTMCPVELAWDRDESPELLLLPIETRLEGRSLGELRTQRRAWTVQPLNVRNPGQLSESLKEVTRTHRVTTEQARALGFWDDEHADNNPPLGDDGLVEVPAWRHALINYPHPLLRQGLVVLDTPGLNAIGAEPELTLSLLPTAHATVFILGADTGVTRSDLAIWRDHLSASAQTRFVVLNKIDALIDPLATLEQVNAQIESQCNSTARILGVDVDRVFPLSARQALAARVQGDDMAELQSRLPALEAALGAQLLPRRGQVLEETVLAAARQIETQVARRVGDARRHLAEQMLELRGLRGKNSGKLRMLLQRIDVETAEFEQCTSRLQALRAVHGRMLSQALAGLSSDRLREEIERMQADMKASILNLGSRKAFIALCGRLRALLADAQQRSAEIRDMLGASFARLNSEFGFSLALGKLPDFETAVRELALIETNYVRYLGLTQALRLSQPRFMEQFRRMLTSKLRVVFETAGNEVDLWSKSTSAQVDSQLRERRRNFARRREALERIQSAASELELRILEIEAQDEQLQGHLARSRELIEVLREQTCAGPVSDPLAPARGGESPQLVLVDAPRLLPMRAQA